MTNSTLDLRCPGGMPSAAMSSCIRMTDCLHDYLLRPVQLHTELVHLGVRQHDTKNTKASLLIFRSIHQHDIRV